MQDGHAVTLAPVAVGELHGAVLYLIAPAVMPRVRVRWKIRKKSIAGRMPISADALVVVASIRRSPCSTPSATGTVWLSFETRKTSGRKNSFQVQMKKKVNSTPMVGRLTGT